MGPAEPLQGSRNEQSRTPESLIALIFAASGLLNCYFSGALRAPDGGPGPRNFPIATYGPFFYDAAIFRIRREIFL